MMIIDYWSKEIEFESYDYAYKNNEFLENYFINTINIKHSCDEILIKTNKKELIPAIGIFIEKWNCIYEIYKDDLEN